MLIFYGNRIFQILFQYKISVKDIEAVSKQLDVWRHQDIT